MYGGGSGLPVTPGTLGFDIADGRRGLLGVVFVRVSWATCKAHTIMALDGCGIGGEHLDGYPAKTL